MIYGNNGQVIITQRTNNHLVVDLEDKTRVVFWKTCSHAHHCRLYLVLAQTSKTVCGLQKSVMLENANDVCSRALDHSIDSLALGPCSLGD